VIGWLGAWPPIPKGLGYQYTIKVGEEWKGTWTNYMLDSDKWFYIASLGHCSVGVLKDQFFKFGGYQKDIMGCMYALGIDDWRERTYINYLRKGRKEVLDTLMERSALEHQKDREWIERKRKHTFNDLLVNQPWNQMNQKRLGKFNGHISVFHDTWLDLLRQAPKDAQDAYDNSKYQKELEEFINKNLSKYVYKRVTSKSQV